MSKLISWVAVAAVLAAFSGASAAQTTRDTGTIVNDAWITTQVYARFFMDADIKGRNIKVETVSGVVTLTIDSDCHRARWLARQMDLGVGTARRGWVEARHVLNTRSIDDVRAFIAAKRRGR